MISVVTVHGIQKYKAIDPGYADPFFDALKRRMFVPIRPVPVRWSRLARLFIAIVPLIGLPGVHSSAMRSLRRVLGVFRDAPRVLLVGHSMGSRLAFDACLIDHFRAGLLVTAGSGPDLLAFGERQGFIEWPSRRRPPVPWVHVIHPYDPWGASFPGPRVVVLPDDGKRGVEAHESYWTNPAFAQAVAAAWIRRYDGDEPV